MAEGASTFMFVLGALAVLIGLVLAVQGPTMVGSGYEEEQGGPFGE